MKAHGVVGGAWWMPRGFTLLEVMVVTVILGLVVGMSGLAFLSLRAPREADRVADPEQEAIASEERESTSTSVPFCATVIEAWKVFSRSSVTVTRTTSTSSSPRMFTSRSCVSGRGASAPCSFIRIAAASGWPIQIGRNLFPSAVLRSTIGCFPTRSNETP